MITDTLDIDNHMEQTTDTGRICQRQLILIGIYQEFRNGMAQIIDITLPLTDDLTVAKLII